MDKFLKWGLPTVGGFFVYWLGGLDNLLRALLAVMVIDYVTGVLKAAHQKNLNSTIGFAGIARKVLLLSVVALSFVIENLVAGTLPLREVVIMFFVANEGLSVLENVAAAGVPLPAKLTDVLEQMRHGGNHEQ